MTQPRAAFTTGCDPRHRAFCRGETSSHAKAWIAIHRALEADIALTVQTVVSRANENEESLLALAADLAIAGVRNWVLHIAVPAGKAAEPRNRPLLPSAEVPKVISRVMQRMLNDDRLGRIRVRVTARTPARTPYFWSAVVATSTWRPNPVARCG